jgi:hypothetical protein
MHKRKTAAAAIIRTVSIIRKILWGSTLTESKIIDNGNSLLSKNGKNKEMVLAQRRKAAERKERKCMTPSIGRSGMTDNQRMRW